MGSWICLLDEGDFFLRFGSGGADDGSSTTLIDERSTDGAVDRIGPPMELASWTVSTAMEVCCEPEFKPTADSPVPYMTFGVAETNDASDSTNTELRYCVVTLFVN